MPSDGIRASAVRLRWETLRLVVQYKRTTEKAAFVGYGSIGGRETRGTVRFLSQSLDRDTLVVDGKVKGVVYRLSGGPGRAGDLDFYISLQSVGADECLREFSLDCDYQAIDIPEALQAEADRVVTSFHLIPVSPQPTDPYAGWAKYTRADYGFSFRYPAAWSLLEGRNFVSLKQRTTRLIIGYRGAWEEINIRRRAELPAGTIVPAGTTRFLGQDMPRALLEHGGKVKAVIYNDAERISAGDRVFLISLEDYAVDYEASHIPPALQAEADRIIVSLVTFQSVTAMATPTAIPTRIPPTPVPATTTPVPPVAVAGMDGANVRSGPGTDYPRLAHLDAGKQVPLIGRHGDWWQIEYGGALAWVAEWVITVHNAEGIPEVQLTPTPGASLLAPSGPVVVAGADGANVRSGPDAGLTLLGYLEPGTQASVIGRYGAWWQIEYDGASAWVADRVVTAYNTDDVPEVEPPPTPMPSSPDFVPTPTLAWDINEPRWIDVDLAHQRVTAYEGRTPVYTTLASTGLPNTPTVEGQFRIWIKLRYDDMTGPGYYLEDVPYVMYFYQGYGFHGVWWHANFGHAMSHGCVNLPTDAAEWLFNWADVGTLVNVRG
jgi:lipoprotein-anchoring transpeptidase ErfK/SrfK